MNDHYDLIVIGAGSGGVRASRMAAAEGKKVALIENRYLGGTCVNVGCVPKKLLVYASEYASKVKEGEGFGVHASVNQFNWDELRDNKTKEIERLNGIYQNMLSKAGVEILWGHGRISSENTVTIDDIKNITGDKILIATGGWPFKPNIPGIEHSITSNEAFYLETFPEKVIVVGGGYIAVEFAGIFNGLGATTTLCYRGDKILRGFDEQVRDFATDEIKKKGICIKTQSDIVNISPSENGQYCVEYQTGETEIANLVMYATGRKPMTEQLGINNLGIKTRQDGTIITDDFFRTSIDSIFAIGDVIGTPALTPVALAQAMTFVAQQYQEKSKATDYDFIPTAVFCQPNIATVGLTEEEAKERYGTQIAVYESDFKPMKHTLSGSNERALMKLIVDKKTHKILGAHMVGADAGEIMQGIAVAIKAGATKDILDSTIGIHPTAAEEFVTMRVPAR